MHEDRARRIDRILVNRDFAKLWTGQSLSTVGDFVFDVTLTLWIATELLPSSTWAPTAVSGLMFCALVAVVVVGPVAGVFVDRWDSRRTMLASEVIRGVLVAGLAALAFLPVDALPAGVWLAVLYLTVLVVNSCGQFFNPARFTTIGNIVHGQEAQTKAFGLSQATISTAAVIGPPLAAPLLFAFGFQWALVVNALSYAVSYVAIRSLGPAASPTRVRSPREQHGFAAWWHEFTAGVRLFRTNRYLTSLLGVAVLSSLGTGAITPLLIFFIEDNLNRAGSLLGILTAAFGLGSVTGALLSGRIARRTGARGLTWLGLLFSGTLLLVFARQTEFVPALVVMFLLAVPVAALNAGISPQLLASTPAEFRGRMIAVFTPANTAASMVSLVVAGILASTVLASVDTTVLGMTVGPIDTILTISAVLIVTAGVIGWATLPPSPERSDASDAVISTEEPAATATIRPPSPPVAPHPATETGETP